ncbi:MAG TPA: oligosaccharide flippase family protein [Polyangiaceae bacterium]
MVTVGVVQQPSSGIRSAAASFVLKFIASQIDKICRFVVVLVAAPALGASAFGEYQFAVTTTLLLALGTELGLGLWTTRALARDPAQSAAIVTAGLRVRVASVGPYLVLLGVIALVQGRADLRWALGALGIATIAHSFVDYFGAALRGHEDFRRDALMNGARAFLTGAAALAALRLSPSLVGLAAGSAIGASASVVVGVLVLRARIPVTVARPAAGTMHVSLGALVPLWLTGLLSNLYFRCDVVLLQLLADDTQVGLYGAAYRLFDAWTILPGAIVAVVFPRLARLLATRSATARLELELGATLLLLGIAAAAVSALTDARLVHGLFGAGFAEARAPFRALAFALPLLFLNFGLSQSLLARERERAYLVLTGGLLALNVSLNLAAIPRFGGVGCAWVTLVTEAARTVGCVTIFATGKRDAAGGALAG